MLIKGKKISSEDLTVESSHEVYDTDSDDDSEIGEEHKGDQNDSPVSQTSSFEQWKYLPCICSKNTFILH